MLFQKGKPVLLWWYEPSTFPLGPRWKLEGIYYLIAETPNAYLLRKKYFPLARWIAKNGFIKIEAIKTEPEHPSD